MLDKLVLAIQFHNCFCDEPVLSREELLNLKQDGSNKHLLYERCQKFEKHISITWPGSDNYLDFVSLDEDGNLHLRSIDEGVGELILSRNGFHFTVHFLYLLPFKKPTWVQIDQTQSSHLKSIMSTNSIGTDS